MVSGSSCSQTRRVSTLIHSCQTAQEVSAVSVKVETRCCDSSAKRQEARSVSICGDDLQLCETVVLIVNQKSEVSAQSLVLLEQLFHAIDPISDM